MNKSLIALLGVMVWSLACDDITVPPKDPKAPRREMPVSAAEIDFINSKANRQRLIEAYNLVVETRNGLIKWQALLEDLKQRNDPFLHANNVKFQDWLSPRVTMLGIREEWTSPVKNKIPKGHPSESLWLAVRTVKFIMEDMAGHFQLGKPLPPSKEPELKQYLDEFEQRMKTWEFRDDAQPGQPQPAK